MYGHRRNRHPQLSSPTHNPFPPAQHRSLPGTPPVSTERLAHQDASHVLQAPGLSYSAHPTSVHRNDLFVLASPATARRVLGLTHQEDPPASLPPRYLPTSTSEPPLSRDAQLFWPPDTRPSTGHGGIARSASPDWLGTGDSPGFPPTPPTEPSTSPSRRHDAPPSPASLQRRTTHSAADLASPPPSPPSSSSPSMRDLPAPLPPTPPRPRQSTPSPPAPIYPSALYANHQATGQDRRVRILAVPEGAYAAVRAWQHQCCRCGNCSCRNTADTSNGLPTGEGVRLCGRCGSYHRV
ncbi:hypothetical protein EsH8_IV_000137 [Colletotrichum jinshuiense]